MRNVLSSILVIVFSMGLVFAQKRSSKSNHQDYVPNAQTAISIAEAIWLPIYGEKIYESKPFVAKLKDSSVWVVWGTLNPQYTAGGTPYIEIQKSDCKVLKVTHGK